MTGEVLFQVIYVAPMKALAAEMVRNFGGRLQPLGISVRELTGDMSLTKGEIMKTQVTLIIQFELKDVYHFGAYAVEIK
jgi:replicative superfamily II helicase